MEPFRAPQAGMCRPQPSSTPAVWLSGAFRLLRMFVLGRFLSACRSCNPKSLNYLYLFMLNSSVGQPRNLDASTHCPLCRCHRRDRVMMFGDSAHLAGTGAACVSDAAAAIQPRFCWRRQSPARPRSELRWDVCSPVQQLLCQCWLYFRD